MAFIDSFKKICQQRGVSPTAVIKSIPISPSSLAGWDAGREPRNSSILKIANYFGITIEELLSGEIKEKPIVGEDDELSEMRQMCKERPDLRMMLQVFKGAKPSDVLQVVSDYQKMRGE